MSKNHLKNSLQNSDQAEPEPACEQRFGGLGINDPLNILRWPRFISLLACVLIGLELVLALALGLFAPGWVLGSFWGSGLVLLNLLALKKALSRLASLAGRRVSLPPYLIGFAAVFALTILVSLAVIGGRLGHPLGFLAGLLLLWPALIIALLGQLSRNSGLWRGRNSQS